MNTDCIEIKEELRKLLKDGERIEKLDLSGWIVLRNLLNVGDDAIIDWPKNDIPQMFNKPVRVTIEGITSNNLLRLFNHTKGARDSDGHEWPVGSLFGCFNVKWHLWKIVS